MLNTKAGEMSLILNVAGPHAPDNITYTTATQSCIMPVKAIEVQCHVEGNRRKHLVSR